MDLMVKARNALMFAKQEQSSGEGKTKSVFKTDRDIPGLCANMMTEKGRKIGIRAYTDAIQSLLQKCIVLEDDHAKRVYQSKSRDDSRGASTVPGYTDAHVAAEKDSEVLAAKEEATEVRREVDMVVAACGIGSSGVARSRL
eukprot:CCRYP_004118-RA/>CCRYP_004118-RA protein AED:0.33 eAED:0.33 QI:0/0/0/1/1/1/2/0/141